MSNSHWSTGPYKRRIVGCLSLVVADSDKSSELYTRPNLAPTKRFAWAVLSYVSAETSVTGSEDTEEAAMQACARAAITVIDETKRQLQSIEAAS